MLLKKYTFEVFTTPCELLFFASSDTYADEVFNIIFSNAKRLEHTYSYYLDTSELYQINHRISNTCPISDELSSLIQLSLFYSDITYGTFDIALAGTMKPASNASTYDEYSEKIEYYQPYASCKHIRLEENTIYFSNDITQIDLGGLVKEYAVDQSVQILQALGIESALVNFGGDLSAFGMYYDKPWRIGIEHPFDPTQYIAEVDIVNSSLCTSGHSKRFRQIDSKIVSHVNAPDNTKEAQSIQVSILAPTTIDAGIWSTALLANPDLVLPDHVSLIKMY